MYLCAFIRTKNKLQIVRKLHLIVGVILCMMLPFLATAQENESAKEKKKQERKAGSPNFQHRFTTFHLEARADFEYDGDFSLLKDGDIMGTSSWDHGYGFRGDYFNFLLGGEIGDHVSYFIRQRIIPKKGETTFFDNTDFLYLQYKFNDQWSIRVGKEALFVGGFEYDAPPIDVYYYTHYWGQFPCFHIGVSGAYTDKSGKNKIVLQIANSPYAKYQDNTWKSGLLSYHLYWNGNYGPFSTLYSINMMEYQRGKFINYIALGNKLSFDRWSVYVDYVNRAAGFRDFFRDFSLVSRLDWHATPSVNIFAKGGYEQNFANYYYRDAADNLITTDMMMPAGRDYWFYGLGLEFRPQTYPDLRVHAYVADAVMHAPKTLAEIYPNFDVKHHTLTANLGVSWRLDFMKFLPAKLR